MTADPALRLVILGAGFIGQSFAVVFADAGWLVTVVEPDTSRRDAIADGLSTQDAALDTAGLRIGKAGRVDTVAALAQTPPDAAIVLECGPEQLDIKQQIFAELHRHFSADTLFATASSAIQMSQIVPDPADQARCLVAHPVNPPAVLRLIELAPAPGTAETTLNVARAYFETARFTAVVLGQEIEGFLLNRLQGAVLREAYRLVEEGVTDVAGIDAVMRLGLGPRWALSGPFETVELNTPGGIRAHAARMGPAYTRMGVSRGETVAWTDALVGRVEAERRALCPADDLPARAAWRARAVARLVALRDRLLDDRDD